MRQDDYFLAVNETLFRMHLDHFQPQPDGDYLDAMTISWCQHLRRRGVPWFEVPGLYDTTVASKARSRQRGFMPTIEDFLHEWDEMVASGYWEEQDDVDNNIPALPPGVGPGGIGSESAPSFAKAFHALSFKTKDGVRCDCPADHLGRPPACLIEGMGGWAWVCARNKCNFRIPAEDVTQLAGEPPA